jgi:hypothetical protein
MARMFVSSDQLSLGVAYSRRELTKSQILKWPFYLIQAQKELFLAG